VNGGTKLKILLKFYNISLDKEIILIYNNYR
jgi:hypothetical protein